MPRRDLACIQCGSEGQKWVADAIPELGALSKNRSVAKWRPTLDVSGLSGPKMPQVGG